MQYMPDAADEQQLALLKLTFCAVLQAPNPGPNPVGPNQLSSQPTAAASSQTLSIVFQCRCGDVNHLLLYTRPHICFLALLYLWPACCWGIRHRSQLVCMRVLTRILLCHPKLPT